MKSEPAAWATLFRKSGAEIEVLVTGTSMEPSFSDGTILRVRCGAVPVAGQIIVFGDSNQLVAHRVEALVRTQNTSYFMTRGDNHWIYDRPIPQVRVMGVVTAVKSAGGWVDPPVFQPSRGFARDFAATTELILLKKLLKISAPLASWHASLMIFAQLITLRLTRDLFRKR